MPTCIHLICRSGENGGLTNLTRVPERPNVYRSETWELSRADADALAGGWLYRHPAKARPSQFRGRVLSVEESGHHTAHAKPEFAFIVKARLGGKGQKWRGAFHAMAWSSGLVEASYPHEMAG